MARTHRFAAPERGADRLEADNFRLGYRQQTHWDWTVGTAFFFAEWGAGVFLVALLVQQVAGMVLGLLLVGVGKSGFQMLHTGVRRRAWRAILRPDRSWISRGTIGVAAFMACGIAHVAAIVLGAPAGLRLPLAVIAGAAALVVATYQGFAMAHSTAIALWSSAVMPMASLVYSLAAGAVSVLLLQSLALAPAGEVLPAGLAAMLAFGVLLLLLAMVQAGRHGSPGARVSIDLLTTGRNGRLFHGVVMLAGAVVPSLALWAGSAATAWVALATAGVLAGFLAFRILILEVGVYEPVLPF